MKSYIYYDSKGVLKEIYTTFNARNGDTKNSIYFICEKYMEGVDTNPDTIVKYRKPLKEGEEPPLDEDVGVEIASEWVDEVIDFDKNKTLQYMKYFNIYHMIKVDIEDLTPSGLWLITPQLDGQAYGLYTFFVENNTLGTDGSITSSDYQYMHDLINNYNSYVITLVNILSNGEGLEYIALTTNEEIDALFTQEK